MAKRKSASPNPDAVALGRLRGKKGSDPKSIKKMPAKVDRFLPAVHLGTLGGKKGGPARAKALTPKQRKQIASKGGKAKAKKG